ncbi:hypothetical protein INT44_008070 [Umbelopsis vinacea]|uniref:TAFII55 protein conserved region domain-containing protein n=1 Tax=Umbelopsis vinacea TaxID=44442 RepID=A0A8H7PP39_9FUNG|nr:hypothetical protein INT44_008070 [Umbelopsis vinacea]KAI9285473.1 TAFII55 protein conserved region-domain-containing protein [Umbelopsis sp. AD052]
MSDSPVSEKRQRKPRQHSSLRSSSNDKKIKIKITAAREANNHSGSEDELEPDVAIEEQFILRMPPGEACNKLRDMVRKRDVTDGVKFYFKDPRHGHFYIDGQQFDTKLVDLPTIIESQKTIDQKQLYKVADISQMLLVEPHNSQEEPHTSYPFSVRRNAEFYLHPDGVTPPLKHVRKRRFRKRLSKRTIEVVEKEVERLLEVDATAEDVRYEMSDNRDLEPDSDIGTQDIDVEDTDEGSESDEDLAAAIDRGLEELEEEDEDDDEDSDDDDDDDDDDEDDEDDEKGKHSEIAQKRQEILEIKAAIQRKNVDLNSATNAILKQRFETVVENLKKQLALKEAHLAELNKE